MARSSRDAWLPCNSSQPSWLGMHPAPSRRPLVVRAQLEIARRGGGTRSYILFHHRGRRSRRRRARLGGEGSRYLAWSGCGPGRRPREPGRASPCRAVASRDLPSKPLKSSVTVTVWSGQKRGLEAHAAVSSSGSRPRILESLPPALACDAAFSFLCVDGVLGCLNLLLARTRGDVFCVKFLLTGGFWELITGASAGREPCQ